MYSRAQEIEVESSSPEHRLWTTVLVRTVQEWLSGPLRVRRMAEDFLFKNTEDFAAVCRAAGLDPPRFRGKFVALKTRRATEVNDVKKYVLRAAA